MSSPEELQNDPEFMASTPADQIAYLSHVDPEFKASHPDDQAEYLAHVTKQPAVPEEKGALKTAWDYYTKPKQAPVMKPFAPPAPSKPAPIELGEQDQQTEAELESQAGVPFHPSQKGFEQLSEALGKFGGKVTEGLAQGLTETPVTGFEQDVPEHVSKEEFEKQHPKYAGAAQAVGEFVGGMAADPRMYAFALLPGAEAAPLINALVSGAFAVDMGKAQVERAKDLGEHWDSMTEQERYKEMTQLGLSSVLAGMAGAHAVEGTPAALKQAGDVGIGTVRAAGRGAQAVVPHAPGAAAALGAAHGLTRGVPAAYFEGKGAGYASKYLAEPLERGANAMATFKMSPEDRNVELLTVDSGKADKAVEKAIAAHSKYEASEAKGAIDPEANPAYKKSLDAVNKAREAQAEAHYHLQEARDAAAAAKEAGAARPEREITPAETALARPDQPTPTDEELKARQEKLMSQIEEKAGVEKPAPVPENVKVPGQVQPETFPQEPTAAPRVDETTQMRPLGDNKGVIMGRPPRLLTEGVPEPAPEAPKGEILPPEKPVKPGRLGALKVGEGGKVIDTEDELQRKIEEGLQGTPKPVAMRPLGAPEETKAPLGGKIEVPQTEAPKYTKKYADTLVDNLHKSIPDAEISIVGSVKRAGESAHDVDLLASEKDMPSITSAMEEQGFKEISGSSNVSPKEAKEAGKEFPTDQWSRVHHFENEEGHKVEVWHKDTSPVEKPTTGHLTDENRRALEHRLGKTNIDLLDSPEGIEAARRFIRGTNKQYADLANTFKIEGGSGENGTWKPEDFKRSRAEHGGELSPKKEAIIKELRNYLPDHADLMEATKEWGPNVESYGAPAGGIDNAHEATVKEGGGEYKGVQEGVPEAGLKGLVLFDHPETHSSLALPEDEVTPEAVRAKLEAHKEAWDKAKMEPSKKVGEPMGAVTERGEAESDTEMARRGADVPTMPGQEAGPAGFPDYKDVADYHNANGGFTYNMEQGFMKDKPGFSVSGEYPDLEKVLPHFLKPDDIKSFVEDPKVKDALEEKKQNSVGGWRYKGKSHLEVSRLYGDMGEAMDAAKKLDQHAIYDHENHQEIPIGGEAAEKAQAKAEKPKTPAQMTTEEFEKKALSPEGKVGGGAPDKVLDKIKTKVNVVPRGEIDVDTLSDGTVRHYLLSDGSMVSEKVPIHSDIENKVGKETLSKAKGIRMAGPQEFDIYSKPTTQQTAELSRITKEANEAYGGKMYWTIKPSSGGDIGGAGSFGDFQRDLEKAYPEKSETKLPELAEKQLLPEEKEGVSKSKAHKPVDHTYEFKDSGTLKHVDAKDKDGNVVATVLATPEEKDPNTWTVGFSKSTSEEKGVGLGAYAKLAESAKSEAERTGKTVTLQGDKQMTAAAVRTWVKLGEQHGYDVQWDKNNRPRITFRSANMKPLGKASSKKIVE